MRGVQRGDTEHVGGEEDAGILRDELIDPAFVLFQHCGEQVIDRLHDP